jgi:hypothetical protein
MHVVFIIVSLALALTGGLVSGNLHHTGAPPPMHTMDTGGNGSGSGSGSGSGGSINGGGPVG